MTPQDKAPQAWSPDGRFLLHTTQDPQTQPDLWALPLEGDRPSTSAGRPERVEGRKPVPVVQTHFDDVQGQFAPDGRWIAYASNESGHYDVCIRPCPDPGGT